MDTINSQEENKTFWSKAAVKWTVSAFLALVFILAFLTYLAIDLVSNTLLDPQMYTKILEENDIYNRVYTELLADPELEDATTTLLGGVKLQQLSPEVYSLEVSTLRLVLPPETIRAVTEGTIIKLTSYIKGETERLEPRLDFSELSQRELMEERITSALETLLARLISSAAGNTQMTQSALDVDALASMADALSQGDLAAVPGTTLASLPNQVTNNNRTRLAGVLLGRLKSRTSPRAQLQVEGALAANDLPSALAITLRESMQKRVSAATARLANRFVNSEEFNVLVTAATYLQETEQRVIDRLNAARDAVTFLGNRLIPLTILLMAISLALIAWVHANSIVTLLRSVGITLLVAGGVAAGLWLALGLMVRAWLAELAERVNASIPQSLESMVTDVANSLVAELWFSVWTIALVVTVAGVLLTLLSFLPNIQNIIRQIMGPLWQHRKAVIVSLIVVVVAVPATAWALTRLIGEGEALPCNGYVELCNRPFDEVAFATTHNAMSISDYGWLWPSHDGSITTQLNFGIRALLIDIHYYDAAASLDPYFDNQSPEIRAVAQQVINQVGLEKREGIYLCHIMCQLGSMPLSDALEEIRRFLESHPREVVVIMIEDKVTPQDIEAAFEGSGLTPYLHTHQPGQPWLTLGEMIEREERLVVMAEVGKGSASWYQNVWDYTEETPYSVKSPESFNCEPNRGGTGKPLFLLNHWIERVSPSRVDAVRVNGHDFLLERARQCAEERGQIPNFIAVNFYLAGEVVNVVNELNGITQVRHVEAVK